MESVAGKVVAALESLEVEDVWDRSGSNRYGYVEPSEAAGEMFEEAIQPFRDEVDQCRRLSGAGEADVVCRGILKGLYDFEEESSSEFKEWAADAPGECFGSVLDDWKKLFGQRRPVDRMTEFLETHCAKWAEWAVKSLRAGKR